MAAVIEVSDSDWCLDVAAAELPDPAATSSTASPNGKFFMVMLNLACIEVIMHLEEKRLEESVEDAELLVACYTVRKGRGKRREEREEI